MSWREVEAERRARARDNGAPDDQERERIIRVEEWRHEARTGIALREAREAMVLPDTPPTTRLSDELREVTDSPPLHIDRLCGQGHNIVVAAQWKAGKTTLAVARVRAEVDGVPFLGEFFRPRGRRHPAARGAAALRSDLLERYSWTQRTNGAGRARPCRCLRPGGAYWEDGVAISFACGHQRGEGAA
jgi:hypothetical protein